MTARITSVHNQRVKDAVRLRDRHGRDDQQRIIIDGSREIARALAADLEVLFLFATLDELTASEEQTIEQARRRDVEIVDVAPSVLKKLAYGERESGLVAVATWPRRSLSALNVGEEALVAVLEHVEKPGNVGAVIRTADAAGVSAVLIADGATDLYNPNAIRASAGTIFSFPVVATSSKEILNWLRAGSFQICATRLDATTRLWEVSFRRRTAVILGSESGGLSELWSGPDVTAVKVPQLGVADSLNVSVTAAVFFYEALRQREMKT